VGERGILALAVDGSEFFDEDNSFMELLFIVEMVVWTDDLTIISALDS
jgi:hypothetical protein